jgi:hypothetical protein
MNEKERMEWLRREVKLLKKERIKLRKALGMAADAINDSAHGHTPNWYKVVAAIDKYEDDYAPLGDD